MVLAPSKHHLNGRLSLVNSSANLIESHVCSDRERSNSLDGFHALMALDEDVAIMYRTDKSVFTVWMGTDKQFSTSRVQRGVQSIDLRNDDLLIAGNQGSSSCVNH